MARGVSLHLPGNPICPETRHAAMPRPCHQGVLWARKQQGNFRRLLLKREVILFQPFKDRTTRSTVR